MVRDINVCESSFMQIIFYYLVLNFILVVFSVEIVCQFVEIFFDNLLFLIDMIYDIFWDLGDGGSSIVISLIYIYENLGIYIVSVDIILFIGCQMDIIFNDLIMVLFLLVVGFIYVLE